VYPKNFQKCIDHFCALQGIGPKLAERLVLSLFKKDSRVSEEFAQALTHLHDITECSQCFNIADDTLCTICMRSDRDTSQLCIVENPLDILPIEHARAYNGLYHVLGGTVTSGNDNAHLTIPALKKRLTKTPIKEIIIATNFTTEGDATALYIKRLLKDEPLTISRIARGLATGSDIEYADDLTLKSALTNRTEMV